MSKATQSSRELEVEDIYDDEIADDDYGFILGPDGELKSVFFPENIPFNPPKNITKILKLFGIYDLENVNKDEPLH
jgi:hypothetical protein